MAFTVLQNEQTIRRLFRRLCLGNAHANRIADESLAGSKHISDTEFIWEKYYFNNIK